MTLLMSSLRKLTLVAMAAFTLVAFWPVEADARRNTGGIGSRGSKTFQAPPPTNTAPKATAPVQRSITQPGKSTSSAGNVGRPTAAAPSVASRFGGWKGIMMGGLLGVALASLLGPGALASMLGTILWFGLIIGALFLIISLFRGRSSQPATATAGPATPQGRSPADVLNRRAAASAVGGSAASAIPPLQIEGPDYDAFERLLGEIQMAYGRSDVDALSTRLTPEMLSYFAEELDMNAKEGKLNLVSDVKLLQGDLSEAWREDHTEYATVAMRYSLIDATVEAATGKVLDGSRTEPHEMVEVWTFVRPVGGTADQWELSAIQPAE